MILSALLDHLWQSTLLAFAAGLVVLTLRQAPASARHGLWFAASAKFLLPFAALTALGRFAAARLPALRDHAPPRFVLPDPVLIERAAEPFSKFLLSPSSPPSRAPLAPAGAGPAIQVAHHAAVHLDPTLILLAVWAVGFAAVLVRWLARWGRVRRVLRSAKPLGWPAPMPVLASPGLMEPGLIGFLRPVLMVPESLAQRLTRSQIDAVLAHEICHLRRRDNLTAALHTLVEAMFWFHPLVWWIGTRLIAERERACDEAVVGGGHDRRTYARSLVECARLYVQSPLSCVSGASGSDLKTRVESIMTAPLSSPLSRSKKALLLAACACALATPVAAGLLTTPEAQKVVARAAALASSLSPNLPGQASAAAPSGDETASTVVPSRRARVAAETLTVANLDAQPDTLTPDLAAPRVEAPQSPAPQLIQTASDAGPAPEPSTAVSPAPPVAISAVELDSRTLDFVRDHSPNLTLPRAGTWRWHTQFICIGVEGLKADENALVWSRIAGVARSAGAPVAQRGCLLPHVRIEFTSDAKQAIARESARRGWTPERASTDQWLVGQKENSPIQAWYLDGMAGSPASLDQILIVVDLRRLPGVRPALVSDYLAMLALSQPRSLDECNALPTITDLFAGACPDRNALQGLTRADAAFLAALYTDYFVDQKVDRKQVSTAQRMADALVNARVAFEAHPAQPQG